MRRNLAPSSWHGFTLIELMVVMAIIATLLAIATPRYFNHLDRARDAALRETLAVTRDALDKYHSDTGNYPETLEVLVTKRYLRSLPVDPVTDSTATWVLLPPVGQDAGKSGIYDLHSGATGNAPDGSPYADW
ncbi:MAG: prepilin-type N-terminal cleavage/methylation domain-containing protein [Rhodocyclaceae bacterium]|nr:MAG: prepilin-type N-terminal cleavage/methylation domain-containing protein [Rhodocyclaceae bacterium]